MPSAFHRHQKHWEKKGYVRALGHYETLPPKKGERNEKERGRCNNAARLGLFLLLLLNWEKKRKTTTRNVTTTNTKTNPLIFGETLAWVKRVQGERTLRGRRFGGRGDAITSPAAESGSRVQILAREDALDMAAQVQHNQVSHAQRYEGGVRSLSRRVRTASPCTALRQSR